MRRSLRAASDEMRRRPGATKAAWAGARGEVAAAMTDMGGAPRPPPCLARGSVAVDMEREAAVAASRCCCCCGGRGVAGRREEEGGAPTGCGAATEGGGGEAADGGGSGPYMDTMASRTRASLPAAERSISSTTSSFSGL